LNIRQGHIKVWSAELHSPPPPHPPHQNQNLIYTDFVSTLILSVLYDLLFSKNQPLQSANEKCITILKNKTESLVCLTPPQESQGSVWTVVANLQLPSTLHLVTLIQPAFLACICIIYTSHFYIEDCGVIW